MSIEMRKALLCCAVLNLGNPFSVVFVLRAGARLDVSVAQPMVSSVS